MQSFDIRPYLGALPILFGMNRAEVHALLGVPQVSSPPDKYGGISDSWKGGSPSIGYDEMETVNHIGFGRGDYSLLLSGSPLWTASERPDPNPALLRLDPNPIEVLGFLIFDRIGVTSTGYHDDDEDDLTITVYPRGAKDRFLAKGKVPDLVRYLRPA